MKSNNTNKTITHLSMPERQIPVLIDAGSGSLEGFVASTSWALKGNGSLSIAVRRILPESLNDLNEPQRRRQFENEFGPVNQSKWNRLLELLALIERWNAGDKRPEVYADEETAQLLEEACPGVSVIHVRKPWTENRAHSVSMDIDFAITAKFTAGLSKAKFVVWQHKLTKRFIPGLYCPDIMTAIYASVLYGLGSPGGLGVCQKCGNPFIRSRRGPKQHYCDHKCQVAAGMKRYRANLERKAKTTTNNKKRAGRK